MNIKLKQYLVGGLEHVLFSHSVKNVIIPTDFHSMIFQRGRAKNHQPDMVPSVVHPSPNAHATPNVPGLVGLMENHEKHSPFWANVTVWDCCITVDHIGTPR